MESAHGPPDRRQLGLLTMPFTDRQAWLAARRADLQACRSAADVEIFKQGMQMAYEASDRNAEGWRVPEAQRQAVAGMVVERQQLLQRGK